MGMTGRKHSEETKNKIRLAHLGMKPTKETRKKLREYALNRPESHRLKESIAQSNKKLSPETKEKIRQANLGRKMSEEWRRNMAKSKYGNTWNRGRTGERASGWKGGISPESKLIRASIEYRLWREAVFARDNWTCQKYGIKGGYLHPHHILNFSSNKELRLAIDNGITLSRKAHKEFHHKYGNRNNTREQIEEFISNKVNK